MNDDQWRIISTAQFGVIPANEPERQFNWNVRNASIDALYEDMKRLLSSGKSKDAAQ